MILIVWIFILLILIGLYFDWKQKRGTGNTSKKYIRNYKIIAVCIFIAIGTCVVGMLNWSNGEVLWIGFLIGFRVGGYSYSFQ